MKSGLKYRGSRNLRLGDAVAADGGAPPTVKYKGHKFLLANLKILKFENTRKRGDGGARSLGHAPRGREGESNWGCTMHREGRGMGDSAEGPEAGG